MWVHSEAAGRASREMVCDSSAAEDENVGDEASLKIALTFYYYIIIIVVIVSHGK